MDHLTFITFCSFANHLGLKYRILSKPLAELYSEKNLLGRNIAEQINLETKNSNDGIHIYGCRKILW